MSNKALNYILVRNKLKNCKGFFPRTLPSQRYNRKLLIERLAAKGGYRRSEYEGVLREFEDTVEEVLREGGSVLLDGFVKFMPKIKGAFATSREKFSRDRHSIEVEAVASRKLSERVIKGLKVERVEQRHLGATISGLSSEQGDGIISPDYPNRLKGVKLAPQGYKIVGVSLQAARGSDASQVMIGLEGIYVVEQSARKILFNFRRNFILPEALEGERELMLKVNYYNEENGLKGESNSIHLLWGEHDE